MHFNMKLIVEPKLLNQIICGIFKMTYPDTKLIRPSSPSFFKYGSLEHPERLKQILIGNQLYFSTQSQLNDPDECLCK